MYIKLLTSTSQPQHPKLHHVFSNSQHIVAAHTGNVTFLATVSILLYLVYGSLQRSSAELPVGSDTP